ncbi:hypothetical protein ACSBR2_026725 [Camellia fascicularis]
MEWTPLASSSSKTQSPSLPPPPPSSGVIMSPCGACKILRRRCVNNCLLAPYFPPTDLFKFSVAHRVFGASNIIKLLQELPESQRADAVSSIVYESNARIKDPVYGCTGIIYQLHKNVTELQEELAKTQAELVSMQCMQAMDTSQSQQQNPPYDNSGFSFDGSNVGLAWEHLWTS